MKYKCQKCGYEWTPRTDKPERCANKKCRCRNWESYIKKERHFGNLSDEKILHGVNYGRLVILMMNNQTFTKNYAETLGKSEAQISTMLNTLKKAGYSNTVYNKEARFQKKTKIWEINQQKIVQLCKTYALSEIEEKARKAREEVLNEKGLIDYLSLDEEQKVKDKFISKARLIEVEQYKKFKQQIAENITNIAISKKKRIETQFKNNNFENFITLFINAFLPSQQFSLAGLTDYYVEWGERL
ncbi:MAG: hypothetical protein ACOCUR_00290 [Nanoarchaeota archaeon]